MKEKITNNLMELRGRIAEACEQYDRDADDISILAVTKRFPASVVQTVVAAGLTDIGESRIQEAGDKIAELGTIARYHLIGHLQTNKVKKAVALFDVIQSVDSFKLAEEINRRIGEVGRTIECLVQVNVSGEENKFGISPESAIELMEKIHQLPSIDQVGLMAIGPLTDDETRIRESFQTARLLFQQGRDLFGDSFDTLSMGMSDDFTLAIAEGSTMIRVGTGLFGSRPQ
ncbi:MAG: YggS family pyridoxal phosphate-dependent enzyme [candidate division Zixibacteria bacterium]|nr:YggS family pyridoxal phosphate-dependent enzyme [candidate division Zixibacteria bacterium]